MRTASPTMHVDGRIRPRSLLKIARKRNITEAQVLRRDAPEAGRESVADADSPLYGRSSSSRLTTGGGLAVGHRLPQRETMVGRLPTTPASGVVPNLHGELGVFRDHRDPQDPRWREGQRRVEASASPSSPVAVDVAVRSVASTQMPESAAIGSAALESSRSPQTPSQGGQWWQAASCCDNSSSTGHAATP